MNPQNQPLNPKTDLTEHKAWLSQILNNSTDEDQTPNPNPQSPDPKPSKNRWDNLYELNKLKQESRNLIVQSQKLKEEKELEKCTFKPYILKTSLKMMESHKDKDVIKRNKEWQVNKQQKLKSIAEIKEDKEKLHCTFQPKIKSNPKAIKSSQNLYATKGTDKFIERQQKARDERKRVEEVLNGNYRLKVNVDKGSDDTNGYTHKFLKSMEPEFDEAFRGMKGKTFSDCTMKLHGLLNGFDINL